MSLVTGLFFLVILSNQRWSPPLHTAVLSVLCVMFRVQLSFVENLLSVFLVQLPNFSLSFSLLSQWLQLLLVWYIRCISIHKFLYFNFFSASFCTTFLSAGIATSISVHVFSFVFLIIISDLFAVTSLSVRTAWFHNTVTSPFSYTGLGMCVYHLSVVSMPKILHIEQCNCEQASSL